MCDGSCVAAIGAVRFSVRSFGCALFIFYGGIPMKSKTTALILSILTGGLGVDRFYLGYTGMGVLKLLTAGCFGVLYIIDIVNIATGKLLPADGSPYDDDTAAAPAQTQKTTSSYEDLEKIAQLHEQGILSDEEYAKMKADCLAKL